MCDSAIRDDKHSSAVHLVCYEPYGNIKTSRTTHGIWASERANKKAKWHILLESQMTISQTLSLFHSFPLSLSAVCVRYFWSVIVLSSAHCIDIGMRHTSADREREREEGSERAREEHNAMWKVGRKWMNEHIINLHLNLCDKMWKCSLHISIH